MKTTIKIEGTNILRIPHAVSFIIVIACLIFPLQILAATAPTISITSPSTPLSLNTGHSQQFTIDAEAASGILAIEWFIGTSSEQWTSYTGSWDYYQRESFTYTFNTAGTYYVQASVYDRETPKREAFVIWKVNVTTQPPIPPTGVSASDGTYTDKVRVTWSSATGATSYEVWRYTSNSPGSASKISSPDPTGTSYDDTSAVTGTTYYYWVKAKNAGGTSGFSSSALGARQKTLEPGVES
jgi:hypothetical protein